MLTNCPECGLNISDKAVSCPHCGYPLKPSVQSPQSSTHRRSHKRLPNGFGQITELKGRNLRKPFRAMITVGKTEEGKPIQKLLKPEAYFETYNEAYEALFKYNKSPFDLDNDPTLEEIYDRWFEKKSGSCSKSTMHNHSLAWKYCANIKDVRVREIRSKHIHMAIEDGSYNGKFASASTKITIKQLLNMLLDYAIEYEYIDRNYARNYKLDGNIIKAGSDHNGHISFTDLEMETLWKNADDTTIDMILFECYTGFRPQELCLLKTEKLDTDTWSIVGGMKTDAGTDRIVPIHPAIREISKKYKELAELRGSQYLFTDDHGAFTYGRYRDKFKKAIRDLGINENHRAHDCRKQFVTMAKKYNVEEYAIKRIVGHAIKDITERTYTDRDLEWLHSEISKIRVCRNDV